MEKNRRKASSLESLQDGIPTVGTPPDLESLDIFRMQLILSEKRTSLSILRTGISIFTLPLAVLTVLITMSRSYSILDNYLLVVPLLVLCLGLTILGIYLIHRSICKIWKQDALIESIKRNDPALADFFKDVL